MVRSTWGGTHNLATGINIEGNKWTYATARNVWAIQRSTAHKWRQGKWQSPGTSYSFPRGLNTTRQPWRFVTSNCTHCPKFFHPSSVWGTARYTVKPAHQRVITLQRPNSRIAVMYVHFEPYGATFKYAHGVSNKWTYLGSITERTDNDNK